MKRVYEKIKEGIKALIMGARYDTRSTLVIVGFIVVMVLLLCGCKSTKTTIVDKSEIRDSTAVSTTIRQDSTLINIDEQKTQIKTDKEVIKDNTTITFGQGGGTFNTITGEATNVLAVSLSMEIDKLKEDVEFWQGEYKWIYTKLNIANDSIANLKRQMDIQSEVEETYQMDWYWFMIIGALLMLIAIVVLRKIPQTSWLLFWI